jgi:hypothetical protein
LLCYEVMSVLFVKWKPALSTRRHALINVPWLNFWLPKEWQPTKRECIFMNPKPSVSPQNTIRNVQIKKKWDRKLHGYGFLGHILCYWHGLPWTLDYNQHCNTQSFKHWLRRVWKHKKNMLLQRDDTRPHTLQTVMRQLRSWISPSYHIRHTVQTLHHAISTFFRRCRKTFVDICRLGWRGGNDCQDLDEGTKCGVLSWRF